MPADPLLDNGQTVEALADALRSGKSGLANVPGLVKVVIRDRCWAERAVGADHRRVAYQDFVRFVTDPPLEGLGTDVQTLERLCADDVEAIRLIAEAKVRPVGGQMNTNNISIHDAKPTHGTSAEYAIRVLANQFPELYEEVKAGRMSPHKAAVQAGIRKKTVTVEAGTFGFARYIKKHFTKDQIADLIVALRED